MENHNVQSNPQLQTPGYNPFVTPNPHAAYPGMPSADFGHISGPQPGSYHAPPMVRNTSGSSSSQTPYNMSRRASPQLEYPPATPPLLTHSRRGSRESTETISSNSTPHSAGSASSRLVQRHLRGHASSSMTPPSPIAVTRKRKTKRRGDDDDDGLSDDPDLDPAISQKLRREDAKKSRQDAEQKRRDQLKVSYDKLRTVVPGATEKTSKVILVNHATQHISKLQQEKQELQGAVQELQKHNVNVQSLNDRLMEKLRIAGISLDDIDSAPQVVMGPEKVGGRPLNDVVKNSGVIVNGVGGSGIPKPSLPRSAAHSRTSSSISNSSFVVPSSGASSMPGPMSAPSHSMALPGSMGGPPLPNSTPSSPLKSSVTGAHSNSQSISNLAPLQIPYPMSYPATSPAQSTSSTSSHPGPAPSGHSPGMQHYGQLFTHDNSSFASASASVSSSGGSIPMSQLALDEHGYPHSEESPAGPHRPERGQAPGTTIYHEQHMYHGKHDGGPPMPNFTFPPQPHYDNPGLGLNMSNGQVSTNGDVAPPFGFPGEVEMDISLMGNGNGYVDFPPQDSGMMFSHQHGQPHSSGYPAPPFMPPSGDMGYPDGNDMPPIPGDYPHPQFTFHNEQGSERLPEADVADIYLRRSPGQQQQNGHHPTTPSQNGLSHSQQSNGSTLSLHPNHGVSPQSINGHSPLLSPANGALQPPIALTVSSSRPQHDPSGPYQDSQRHGPSQPTYIVPTMIMSDSSSQETNSTSNDGDGDRPSNWY